MADGIVDPLPESAAEYHNMGTAVNEISTTEQKISYESEDSDFGDFNPNLHAAKPTDA